MSHARRFVRSVLPLIVVVGGLASCGSDDNSPSTPTSPGVGATTPSSTPSTQDKGGVPVAPGNGEPQPAAPAP